MTSQWPQLRRVSADATDVLSELLHDPEADSRRLIVGYLDAKRQLAKAFQALAEELWLDPGPLALVKGQIEEAMHELYPELPAKHRLVRGFGKVHEMLFAYLNQRVGEEVMAEELRVLTADAVHTERRARDLRDLGLQIDTYEGGGMTVYVLRDAIPSSEAGARTIALRNVREDKSLTIAERDYLLSQVQ